MPPKPLGLLHSGGLDSSILLAELLRQGQRVQPFYIRTDVVWAAAELAAIRQFLEVMESPGLQELIVFDLPLGDLYQDHWSISGVATPDGTTTDEAVFLPGRNALLTIKPLLWCQTHGIAELALATLACNPFADARPEFLQQLSAAMATGGLGDAVRITQPFAGLNKEQVLQLGRELPLEHTFSCISPRDGRHCGQCNKCAERRAAFASSNIPDPTNYFRDAMSSHVSPKTY